MIDNTFTDLSAGIYSIKVIDANEYEKDINVLLK